LASAPVETLQLLSLEWASFARFMMASGVFLTLKEESEAGRSGTFTTRALNGIVALCTLTIAIPPLVLRTNDVLPMRRLIAITAVCGYNAVKGKKA